ncbi:MAG TPA: 5'-nucleotidase C-terminal domain-containing protein [Polyangiaceae bacterium]|nr:5'-nucleotidase C-terminal domain-containing protein [Polyangiaceae bacterium]
MPLSPWILAGLSSLLCVGCTQPPPQSARPQPPPTSTPSARSAPAPTPTPFVLSFLGLNDLHGRLRALPAFAGYVDNVRRARAKDGGAVAVVDAGDMFQGTLESNLTAGASVIEAYRVLGMTVATLGNHEFDFGPVAGGDDPQGAIRARISEASFPILSANLVVLGSHTSPPWTKLRRSVLLNVGGVRVGFVGLLTFETPSIVLSAWFTGLDVTPLAPALAEEARSLRAQGAEIVIGIAHAGADCKDFSDPADVSSCTPNAEIFEVARALPAGSVDAIFAGHSHAGVAHLMNGIPIVEAYARGRAFSRIDLRVDGTTHRVLERKVFPPHELCPRLTEGGPCTLSDYEGEPTREAPEMARAIAPALAKAEQFREEPIGCTVEETLACEHGSESALGNLFADLLREAVPGADVAILNGGSLRAELPAGQLNYGQLFEAMPFDNLVAKIRLTGAELKTVLENHLRHDAHGLISLSGMRVNARCGKSGFELQLSRENGKPVSDRETLLLATSDYLATGGDALFRPIGLSPQRIEIDIGLSFRDALARSLKHHPQLSPKDPTIFDPTHPRLKLSSPRPMLCAH